MNTISFVLVSLVIIRFNPIYLPLLIILQIPRLLTLQPILDKITYRQSVSAKLSRPWYIYLSFLESVTGSYEARILGIRSFVKNKLLGLREDTIGLFEKTELELLTSRVITSVTPMLGTFVIGFLEGRKVIHQELSIGNWQFIFNTAYRVNEQLKGIIDNFGELNEAYAFIRKLVEVLGEEEIFNKLISNVDKKIMILISHRFSTVRQADKIFVLDGGTIKEQGSHKELIAQNGLYTRLFRLQSKSYEE